MIKICWHKWSWWSKPIYNGIEYYQVRTCSKCDKIQFHQVPNEKPADFIVANTNSN